MATKVEKVTRLAIIGGCMASQQGIPYSKLYHRQLRELWQAKQGIRLQVLLAHHVDQDYCQRLEQLNSRGPIDLVLLHIRVEPFRARIKFYLRYYNQNGKLRLRLNPYLKNRPVEDWSLIKKSLKLRSPRKANEDARFFEKPPKFRLFNLNVLLAFILGVIGPLVAEEMRAVKRLAAVCKERKIPFLVLAPTPFRKTWLSIIVYKSLSRKIMKALADINVPACCMSEIYNQRGEALLKPDRYHLSISGHQAMAELLYQNLCCLIDKG